MKFSANLNKKILVDFIGTTRIQGQEHLKFVFFKYVSDDYTN